VNDGRGAVGASSAYIGCEISCAAVKKTSHVIRVDAGGPPGSGCQTGLERAFMRVGVTVLSAHGFRFNWRRLNSDGPECRDAAKLNGRPGQKS
jgi:hypothetical protein